MSRTLAEIQQDKRKLREAIGKPTCHCACGCTTYYELFQDGKCKCVIQVGWNYKSPWFVVTRAVPDFSDPNPTIKHPSTIDELIQLMKKEIEGYTVNPIPPF